MNSDQFLKDIQGKNVNFLIGSGASFGVVPTLWVKSIEKSFEELLTSKNMTKIKEKFFILFGLSFGYVKQRFLILIKVMKFIININDLFKI